MNNHKLKTHPKPFTELLSGDKTAEIRACHDRNFQRGDTVTLVEIDPVSEDPTGRILTRGITHVQTGYGIPEGYCVLSYSYHGSLGSQFVIEPPSAAPEQEPVTLPGKQNGAVGFAKGFQDGWNTCLDAVSRLGPLYTHADPSEVERLRAELAGALKLLGPRTWKQVKEAKQRADAAERKLEQATKALKFYADGDHLLLADPDSWDTCSGEPQNFLRDEAGTASVEDGSVAKATLEALLSASAEPAPECFCVEHGLHIETLQKLLRDFLDSVRNAPVSSGVCCCGSNMDSHGMGDGHSPVDEWDELIKSWTNTIEAVLPETCCVPTAEELASLQAGDYTPEELWGGPEPTCPKCIGKKGTQNG